MGWPRRVAVGAVVLVTTMLAGTVWLLLAWIGAIMTAAGGC